VSGVFIRKAVGKPIKLNVTKDKSGFTLLELLVVVGILAALVALALPFYQDYVNQSKLTAAEADLQTFKKALAMYDQLESSMFGKESTDNFRTLIGRYLQDFRAYEDQAAPIDPWSNDYKIDASAGVIYSCGPNGDDDSETTVVTRVPSGDDIMVTWKPDFFLATAKRVNARTIDISFSRRVDSLAVADIDSPNTIDVVQKISDTIYRLRFSADLSLTGTVQVVNTIQSQDGRLLSASGLKPDGDPNTQADF